MSDCELQNLYRCVFVPAGREFVFIDKYSNFDYAELQGSRQSQKKL
jgi:hypothetical protein